MIGAVVGVQPFGGHGLSGTGPKAGGPLYLERLRCARPRRLAAAAEGRAGRRRQGVRWTFVAGRGDAASGRPVRSRSSCESRAGVQRRTARTGRREERLFARAARRPRSATRPRESTLIVQVACALATGNRALLSGAFAAPLVASLPEPLRQRVAVAAATDRVDAALTDRESPALVAFAGAIARRDGPIASVFRVTAEALRRGEPVAARLPAQRALAVRQHHRRRWQRQPDDDRVNAASDIRRAMSSSSNRHGLA